MAEFLVGNESQQRDFATNVTQSFATTGFVKVVNHGISNDMVDQLFEWSRRFFALPIEAKAKASHPPSRNTPQRGWSNVGVETTGYLRAPKNANLLDSKEHFDQGSTTDTMFPSRWPDESDLPEFRTFMEIYYLAIYDVAIQVMSALEVGLGLPETTFTGRCTPSASDLRLNHYPAIPACELTSGHTSRIWPHTDFGLVTPLFQDGVGGLEVEDRNNPGNFLPVRREIPYEMVLNVSDTLERWTNGFLKSGVHRVNIPQALTNDDDAIVPDRYSVAFFFKAEREQKLGPLAQFVKGGEAPKYENFTSLEFQVHQTQNMYEGD